MTKIFKLCSLPRIQDGVYDAAQNTAATVQTKETDLDEGGKRDVNAKKVEHVVAYSFIATELRSSEVKPNVSCVSGPGPGRWSCVRL